MRRLPLLVVGLVVACKPGGEPSGRRAPTSSGSASASPSAPPVASAPTYDPEWRQPKRAPTSDPLRGRFGMAEVDRALPGEGDLVATITTTLGTLRCTLFPQRAPHHVAAFVGLASGLRPFQDAEGWSTRPAYDGTAIDRVVPGVLIAGGRPLRAVEATPGFAIPPERWPEMRHDRAGLLCAGSLRREGGAELLLTAGDASHLDRGPEGPAFTVFGECTPTALIDELSRVPADHARPRTPLQLERIQVRRVAPAPEPSKGAAPGAK